MSRTELLSFNRRWNDRDRAILTEDLEQFGAASYEHSSSGYPHVWVHDAEGELIMQVAKGTIYYKGGRSRPGSELYAPGTDNPDHIVRLSTHQAAAGHGKPEAKQLHPLCTTCFLHHADGDCDR